MCLRMPSGPSSVPSVLSWTFPISEFLSTGKENPGLHPGESASCCTVGDGKVVINSFFWHSTFQRVGQRTEMIFVLGFVFSKASLQRLSWSGFHNDTCTLLYILISICVDIMRRLQSLKLSMEGQQYIHHSKLTEAKSSQGKVAIHYI